MLLYGALFLMVSSTELMQSATEKVTGTSWLDIIFEVLDRVELLYGMIPFFSVIAICCISLLFFRSKTVQYTKMQISIYIHFVVSQDTIDEAILRLENDLFPEGISAVVFILYKPVGLGVKEKVIKSDDPRLIKFFSFVTEKNHSFRLGFDTCFTPAILRMAPVIPENCIDACEAATYSMYIDSQLNCFPCSFGIWDKSVCESMRKKTLREIWNGDVFAKLRNQKKKKCHFCQQNVTCRGGCRIGLDIDLC